MSGGSYNYLFAQWPEILCGEDEDWLGILSSMSDRLAGLGYAYDAAKETEECLLIIRHCYNQLQPRMDRLSSVWKAIEWWDSHDSGEEAVKEALELYRRKA